MTEGAGPSPGRRARWPRSRAGRIWLALLAAAALLVAGLGILYATLPDGSEYRSAWPRRTAYMELRIDQARAAGRPLEIRYEPVSWSRIPESLRRAVRVAEDAGFYGHGAFDFTELRAALRQAWREDEAPRGASTITQQLARNLYLSPKRSLWRKLREALIAVRIEHALSKRRIFELYLNVIELGPGTFGVQAASERYFGVPADRIGPDEAVRLAATIPSPLEDNPATDTRRFRWRVGLIAGRAFPPDTSAPGSPGGGTPAVGPGAAPADTAAGLPSPDSVPAEASGAPDSVGAAGGPDSVGAPDPAGARS
ncbi:MAG TPA: transglycosylase domain-containing protein [Gemmatimonadota bacterium]|nr:transglycosylase domain-containing protein [Gemmatimonadota bacterium]